MDTMETNEIHRRFYGSSYYEDSKKEFILIAGCGGIGSNTAHSLARSIPAKFYLIDNDTVEEHNIGTQFFKLEHLGHSKVKTLTSFLYEMSVDAGKLFPMERKLLTNSLDALPISIAAFDNMEARKLLFKHWKSLNNKELFVDGRLRANYYEVYAVTPGLESRYEDTLFSDGDVDAGMCTFKQTTYFGHLIGARIANIVINYLSNKYSEIPTCKVPFCIKEFGDLIKIDIEW